MMRTAFSFLLVLSAASVASANWHTFDNYDKSSKGIRAAVSGKTCEGSGQTIRFGRDGRFERVGRPVGKYAIGPSTILVERGGKLHTHITSVGRSDKVLYMGIEKLKCLEDAAQIE